MYITMPEIHHTAAWHLLRSHLFIFFILPKSPIFPSASSIVNK